MSLHIRGFIIGCLEDNYFDINLIIEYMLPNINYTLKHDLCTGCGICESACPSGAITTIVKDGRFVPQIMTSLCKNSSGCHRCYDSCSGIGVNLCQMAQKLYEDKEIKQDDLAGRYIECFTGHSTEHDIRYHCASGGMVSQFLIFLLDKGYIDGAVVTAFDSNCELMVNSYIAYNKEDILRGKGSKYAPVSLNQAARCVKKSDGNNFVIVGLPCHIQSFRKLELIDKRFREKIIGYFAIYCSSGRTFYLTEHVLKHRNINKNELTYFAYRDEGCLGSMVAQGISENNNKTFRYVERYQEYYHPLRSFFIPRRCLFCIDHYGELGDVCFGDIHIAPYIDDKVGVNSLVVRKRKWLEWLLEAKREGYIVLDEISIETLNSSQKMAYKKKGRNKEFIKLNKILGRIVPEYDEVCTVAISLSTIIQYTHNRLQQFIGSHKSLWFLINFLKGRAPQQ